MSVLRSRARARAVACAVLLLAVCAGDAALVRAQPRGPADIISGARRARDERDLQEAAERGAPAQPAQAAPPDDTAAAPAGDPHAGHAPTGEPDTVDRQPIATEREDASLPDGTIAVRVVDASGAPAAGADVSLGIMGADSKRSSRDAKTNAEGLATFSGLSGGERQAYRVNVPYQGARYSSTPFRLPIHGGYHVEVRRLPTTHDERLIVVYLGATSVELKDERLKIVQQVKLLNLGGTTYVFPEQGTLVKLPPGFIAVQTQESMTDQHVSEAKGEGLRVKGSLPPGDATLMWGFDLPVTGSEADFSIDVPWLIFAYRVITDAPPGMTLEVDGMPPPFVHADAGRRFLVTEVQRKVGDEPFRRLHIKLHGLPAPGPSRWIAAALALFAIGVGVFGTRRQDERGELDPSADFEARKSDLLARARELRDAHAAGDIGPEYHAQQMGELETELSELLFEQARYKSLAKRRAPAPSRA
jgi:hypothetical protein